MLLFLKVKVTHKSFKLEKVKNIDKEEELFQNIGPGRSNKF